MIMGHQCDAIVKKTNMILDASRMHPAMYTLDNISVILQDTVEASCGIQYTVLVTYVPDKNNVKMELRFSVYISSFE